MRKENGGEQYVTEKYEKKIVGPGREEHTEGIKKKYVKES